MTRVHVWLTNDNSSEHHPGTRWYREPDWMGGPGPYRTRIPDGDDDGYYRFIEGNGNVAFTKNWVSEHEYDATTEDSCDSDSLDNLSCRDF